MADGLLARHIPRAGALQAVNPVREDAAGVVRDTAADRHHRDMVFARGPRDTERGFAGYGLKIHPALAGYHQIGPLEMGLDPGGRQHDVNAALHLRPDKGNQAGAQPAGGAGAV